MPDPQVWMEEVVRAARTRPRERRTRPCVLPRHPRRPCNPPSHNIASERFLALHPIVSPAKVYLTSQEHTASSPEFSPEHTFHGPTKERV